MNVCMLLEVLKTLWFILPCYVANAAPLMVRRGLPLDFGCSFIDGRRVFGDGKTVQGFIVGVALGVLVGFFQELISGPLSFRGLGLSLGAMLGDLAGSFIKRRLGFERGEPAPLLDQIDFLVGALTLSFLLKYTLDFRLIVIAILLTPPIHLAMNILAYYIGLKKVPW